MSEVADNIQPLVGSSQRIFDMRGYIFISAPPSVTPFHIDRENNFWLQLRGKKSIYVWDNSDRSIVPDPVLERFVLFRSLHDVHLEDRFLEKAQRFDCGPGDGVFFPSTTPHMTESKTDWVTPGDGVTISIGMVFYTDLTRRHARSHMFNWQVRRLGWKPRPVGSSDALDRLKGALGGAMAKFRKKFRGYRPPPGIV